MYLLSLVRRFFVKSPWYRAPERPPVSCQTSGVKYPKWVNRRLVFISPDRLTIGWPQTTTDVCNAKRKIALFRLRGAAGLCRLVVAFPCIIHHIEGAWLVSQSDQCFYTFCCRCR